MKTWPDMDVDAIDRYLRQLRLRSTETVKVYRCILSGFQRFVMKQQPDMGLSQSTISTWLRERADQWQMHIVLHRARTVDRFLDFLVSTGSIPSNPFAELRVELNRYAMVGPRRLELRQSLRSSLRLGATRRNL